MKTYLFYSSDITVNVYEKATLTPDEKKRLAAQGMRKLPFETSAEDEAEAVEKMLNHFQENTEALKEFAKDYAIASALAGLVFLA